jgi:hypothetical protein
MATLGQIQTVAKHYLIAALWADCDEGTSPRVPVETRAIAFNICKAFIDANNELFNEAMARFSDGYGSHPDAGSAEAAFGHDLWLTTRRHGTGFWDRKELDRGDLGDRLTEACHAFGEPNYWFYRGWFYLQWEQK